MQGNSKKKRSASVAALVMVAIMAGFIGAFLLIIKGEEDAGADGILLLYIGIFAAIIVGVLLALKQRFKEIESGEEEEARKY